MANGETNWHGHDADYCDEFPGGCTCVDCPACEGTGEDPMDVASCYHCFGGGHVPASEVEHVGRELERRMDIAEDEWQANAGDHDMMRARRAMGAW